MLLVTAILFTLVSIGAICIGRKTAGLLSWGSLVPMYFLFMLGVFPLVSYVNGVYLTYIIVPTERDVTGLYAISTIGIVAFSVAYLFLYPRPLFKTQRLLTARYARHVSTVFRSDLNVALFLATTVAGALWSIAYGYFGLTSRDSSEISASAGFIGIVSTLMSFLNIILWSNRFEGVTSRHATVLRWMSLAMIFVFAFASNSKGALLFPFVHVLLAYYFVKGRIPVKAIGALTLFFFLFAYPLIQGFRFAILLNLTDQSAASMIPQLLDYLIGLDWLDAGETPEGDRQAALGRGIFSYLAHIYRTAGDTVPFLHGRTYLEGLQNLVPRLILPTKVDMNTGNWTGQLFDHVSQFDLITNVSPSYLGEFYMNNGVVGVIVGMLVLGVAARIIDESIFKSRLTWLKVLFVMNILWLEAFIGTTVLVFVKTFATFMLVVFVLSKLKSRSVTTLHVSKKPS